MKYPVLFVLYIIFILLIIVDTLFTKQVDLKTAQQSTHTFRAIERVQLKNKHSYSYNLFVNQKKDPIVIAADYASCFDEDIFSTRVKQGDSITIFIQNLGLLRRNFVVSVRSRDAQYLDVDCLNRVSNSNKWIIPLIGIGGLFLIWILKYLNKKDI